LTAAVVAAGVGFGALSVLAAGCSDAGDEITIDSTTTESTTSTASTTTTEPSTTESTPTTLDDEAAIRGLHEYFLTEVVARDERDVTFEQQVELLETVAVDPLLTRAIEARSGHYERGEYAVTPPGDSNVVDIQIEGDRATVIDCFLDSGVLYAADGVVLVPADLSHEIIEVRYEFRNGRWFLSDFLGGDEQCEPDV
jgi:hypothetical protein